MNKKLVNQKNISELGFNHQQQINIIKGCQDLFLKTQSKYLEDTERCPECGSKLIYVGSTASHFHSVFTDHKVQVKRKNVAIKNVIGLAFQALALYLKPTHI